MPDTHHDSTKPVLIIGSGCTGLAIAHGLKNAGIPAIIFEKNAAVYTAGERDWNMGLHWAIPTLRSLIPETSSALLQSVQVDPNTPTKDLDTLSFLNGSTGEVLGAPQIPHFHRLRRSKIRALLARGLDIKWGKKLIDIVYGKTEESGVTAIFEDGEQVEGRLIVGVDGARSRVRSLLVGREQAANTRLPYVATFVQAKYTREQALFLRSFHPLYIASHHPDGLFAFFGLQHAPEVDKPEDWIFFFYVSWESSLDTQDEEAKTFGDKERLRQVSEFGKRFCDPWKSAFEWLSEDQTAWYHGMAVWDPSLEEHAWDNKGGRVTLAGDAAHPMTYQRGQGLNHSITDAGLLVQQLTSISTSFTQSAAIDHYEKEMKARAGEEVKLSVLNTAMLHDWQQVLQSPVVSKGLKAGG